MNKKCLWCIHDVVLTDNDGKDAAALRNIPRVAYWHMAHRPYRIKGECSRREDRA